MDLVKMLTAVEFTEVRRGLDRDEVGAFLQQVASAVMALERRLADTVGRAERAESKALEMADDSSIRKTLVLAQRTADAAVHEAEEEARRIVVESEHRANSRIAEADAHSERTRAAADDSAASTIQSAQARANQLIVEAKTEAHRSSDELRSRLRQEVIELETARDTLLRDVALFEAHMGEQRTRVQGALGALQMVLDHPDALRKMAVPTITSISLPDKVEGDIAVATSRPGIRPPGHVDRELAADSESLYSRAASMVGNEREDLIIDLADSVDQPNTAEVPVVAVDGNDDELVRSFFEQSTFDDDRWKGRKDRRRV